MAIRNLLTRGIGFAPAGVNFLVTHGFSSGVEVEPPIPPAVSTLGGAVIVDIPSKRKKRTSRQSKETDNKLTQETQATQETQETQVTKEFTEDQVNGMEAVYGATMRVIEPISIQELAQETDGEDGEIYEPILDSFAISEPIYEVITHKQQVLDHNIISDDDEISLILAIIEAIW